MIILTQDAGFNGDVFDHVGLIETDQSEKIVLFDSADEADEYRERCGLDGLIVEIPTYPN